MLDFASDHGKIQDANGFGTGFTYIDPPTNGTGYIPANLSVDTDPPGLLDITTTSGSAFQERNSLDNALAVGIDAPAQVTRLRRRFTTCPLAPVTSNRAGLRLGNDEDNYVKLMVISPSRTGCGRP